MNGKRLAALSVVAAGIALWAAGAARADDSTTAPAAPAAPAPAAPAAAPAADTAGKISYNGLIDWYYGYSFNHPPTGANLTGRSFDIKHDQFSFSLAEVNITRTPGKDVPIGFTATITLGKTADLVHATEPDGFPLPANGVNQTSFKYLQQIYGTYITPGPKPLTIDFGKFVTMMGYEVIESSSNDNYSRSLLFNYAIPFYHAGVRLTYPLSPTVTAQLHIVNGWNNVQDDNGAKSIGGQLAWAPNAAWSWYLNYMGGDESTGAYGNPAVNLNTQTVDLVGVWKPTAKLKLGVNVDYASAAKKGQTGGNWSGEAVYGRYQISTPWAVALRAEHFEDSAGLRTGVAQNLNEVTATLEYAWKANLLHRLEFRHDHAGSLFFPSGGGGSHDQDTLTFSQVIKF